MRVDDTSNPPSIPRPTSGPAIRARNSDLVGAATVYPALGSMTTRNFNPLLKGCAAYRLHRLGRYRAQPGGILSRSYAVVEPANT